MLFKNANNKSVDESRQLFDKMQQFRQIRLTGNGAIQAIGGQQVGTFFSKLAMNSYTSPIKYNNTRNSITTI